MYMCRVTRFNQESRSDMKTIPKLKHYYRIKTNNKNLKTQLL